MRSSSFPRSVASYKRGIYRDRRLRDFARRNSFYRLLCCCGREWSFRYKKMEVNARSNHSNEKQSSAGRISSANAGNTLKDKNGSNIVFVNHAEIAWHENRRKWIGDRSQQQKRRAKDPIISWSTTYEELLLHNEPFSEPIPLAEMVDFLVDIWHDEGLFD